MSDDQDTSGANDVATGAGEPAGDSRIFVCYSHNDAKTVYADVDWLRRAGCEFWVDRNLEPGTMWRSESAQAIERASAVLFYVSPSSVASANCNREINYALDCGTPIVPVYIAETELCADLRIGLSRVQAIRRFVLDTEEYRRRLLGVLTQQNSVAGRPPVASSAPSKLSAPSKRKAVAAAAAGLFAIAALGAAALIASRLDFGGKELDGQPIRSLAIMPFENAGGDPAQDYFVEGVAAEVTSGISLIPGLHVVPVESTKDLTENRPAIGDIAERLGVAAVLDGSVQRNGDAVAVGLRLTDAKSGKTLIDDAYAEALGDLPSLTRRVAGAVAKAAKLTPAAANDRRFISATPVSAEVYELYLRGRYFWNKRDEDSLKKSVEYFERAAAIDPDYAPAYSGLADAWLTMFDYEVDDRHETTAKAREAVRKALALDDASADAHKSLAHLHLHDWNWAESKREFQRAVALDPANASTFHWYALCLTTLGETDKAVEAMLTAQRLDPISVRINTDLGMAYYAAGRFDEAIAQETRMLELDPEFSTAFWIRGMAYEGKGDYAAAIKEFKEALRRAPTSANSQGALAHALARMGRGDEARKIAADLKARNDAAVSPFVIAIVYAGLDEVDEAFAWLEKAYETRDGSVRYLKADPRLESLRTDPRFADLMRRVGLAEG